MLLGCSPDSAAATDSAVNSNAEDDGRLVKKALGCELLCHVARAVDLPPPKRFVTKTQQSGGENLNSGHFLSMPEVQ